MARCATKSEGEDSLYGNGTEEGGLLSSATSFDILVEPNEVQTIMPICNKTYKGRFAEVVGAL